MSGNFLFKDFKIESIEDTSDVPNDDVARLMYYLSCVHTVIFYDEDDHDKSYLTDYRHYYRLSSEDKQVLLLVAAILNPIIFLESKVFIVLKDIIPSFPLSYNMFFKITDQRIGFHINESMLIGGKSVKVLKIMVFSESWLDEYYINPFKRLNRIYSKKNRSDDDDCCCLIF